MEGQIQAPRTAFVGLRYYNPPGGIKYCLNSKFASCELTLKNKRNKISETLLTTQRTAFEILTDRQDHGVQIMA